MDSDLWRQAVERSRGLLSADEETRYGASRPSDIVDDFKNTTSDKAKKVQTLLDKVQPLVDTISRVGSAMDLFVSAAPGILSPLWGGLRVVLLFAKDAGCFFPKFMDMLQSIGSALPRFQAYEQLFPQHESLQRAVLSVFLSVVQFLAKAKQFFSGSSSSLKLLWRFTWRPFDQMFQESLIQIRKQSALVEHEAKLAHFREESQSRQQVVTLNEVVASQVSASDLENLKRWIGARQCQEEMEGIEICPGTCDWILDRPEMSQWISSDPGSPQFIWIHGPPGCGKSFIYAKIIDYLDKHLEQAPLYFLFCGADNQRTTVSALVRAWTCQLVTRFDEARKTAIDQQSRSIGREASKKEVTSLFLSLLDFLPVTFLSVDALDECEDRSDFLRLLPQIPSRVKVLVTSRYIKDLSTCLDVSFDQRLVLEVTADMTRDDISRFVRTRVQASKLDYPPEVESTLMTRLASSSGMFLWVRFMLEEMEQQTNVDEMMRWLRSGDLPTGLTALYERILQRINNLHPAQRLLAHKVFFWVNIAMRPLRAKEVDALLAVTLSEADEEGYHASRRCLGDAATAMTSVCESLITARGDDKVLYPVHFTVTEHIRKYMDSSAQVSEITKYYESESFRTNHALASAVCIRYLLAVAKCEEVLSKCGVDCSMDIWPEFDALIYSSIFHGVHYRRAAGRDKALRTLWWLLHSAEGPSVARDAEYIDLLLETRVHDVGIFFESEKKIKAVMVKGGTQPMSDMARTRSL